VAIVLKKKTRGEESDAYKANALRAAVIADEKKGEDIKAYDVIGLTGVADCFLIVSASSEPQMKAIINAIRDGLREVGVTTTRVEGDFHGGWVLLDYSDLIVHVFRKEAREFYDLDGVWADAPQLDLGLEA